MTDAHEPARPPADRSVPGEPTTTRPAAPASSAVTGATAPDAAAPDGPGPDASGPDASGSNASGAGAPPVRTRRWRTVDIVVASVLGVAFGVLFMAWNNFVYPVISAPLSGSPLGPLVAGVWLVPAVVGALIIRKPGAALYTEVVASTVSMLAGSVWGLTVFMSGFWQGVGAELVFALLAYRRWGLGAAVLAGAGAGVAMGVYESFVYVAEFSFDSKVVYVGAAVVTGVVLAGVVGWLLVRALARTGALAPFASGRAQREV